MTTETSQDLAVAAEISACIAHPFVQRWVEGAIFPSEMAFFIAKCIVAKVDYVIESGRQDGFSTEILGQWATRSGARIVSIDLELDPARARACRERLAALPIDIVKGSAYTEFGRYAATAKPGARTAFLADGPKGWPAVSMMAAAVTDGTQIVSMHNLVPGFKERDLFESLGGSGVFYEGAIPSPGPQWQAMLRDEREHSRKVGAVRDAEVSSLGVLAFDSLSRRRFRGLWRGEFGLHQPEFVRRIWQTGAYSLATKLYGASQRLLHR